MDFYLSCLAWWHTFYLETHSFLQIWKNLCYIFEQWLTPFSHCLLLEILIISSYYYPHFFLWLVYFHLFWGHILGQSFIIIFWFTKTFRLVWSRIYCIDFIKSLFFFFLVSIISNLFFYISSFFLSLICLMYFIFFYCFMDTIILSLYKNNPFMLTELYWSIIYISKTDKTSA